jgi:hypothetical protein
MPNIKISQLPGNNAPDGGTIIPNVQAGVTCQTALQDVVDNFLNIELAGTFQPLADKTQNISVDGTSTIKYPSASAVKTYVDGITVGLLSDRGNYTPGLVSPGAFPTTGGRGPGGAPVIGDLWFVAANGFLGTTAVTTGQSVRALVNSPGQTSTNWDILDVAGWTVAPEDSANKVTSKAAFISNGASTVKYPSIKAVKDYIDTEITLQDILDTNHDLTSNINLQGTGAGSAMGAVTSVNAFGFQAAAGNTGNIVNAFGPDAANSNSGNGVNAIGSNAGNGNTGNYLDAMGDSAADSNTGDNVVAIGQGAAGAGTANQIVAIGANAGASIIGDESIVLGKSAGQGSSGPYTIGIGSNAAKNNSGTNVNAVGVNAGQGNSANDLNAFGESAGKNNSGSRVNAIGYNAGFGNTYGYVNLLGSQATASGNSQLVFTNTGGFNARLDADALTGDRDIVMPNASGTMVLSVNGTAPNPAGDVTISIPNAGLPYLMYAAYLQFNPGSIVATQLFNTIGDGSGDGINDIAWNYGIGGWYEAKMSAGPFTTKTAVIPSGYIGNGQYFAITGNRVSASQMNVLGIRPSDNSFSTAFVPNVYVEIRIYP